MSAGVPNMNKIKVKLLKFPKEEDLAVISNCARMTQNGKYEEKKFSQEIFDNLVSWKHDSLLEMCDVTVLVEGASRVFLSQVTRHRMASFVSSSQHYTLQTDFDYVIPDSIKDSFVTFPGPYQKPYHDDLNHYNECMFDASQLYNDFVKKGIDKDHARYVLPNACRINLVIKANLREWLSVIFPQRLCKRASSETVHVMKLIREEMQKAGLQNIVKWGVPSCVYGMCTQGKMACGEPYSSCDL